jgi:hypothetical protein
MEGIVNEVLRRCKTCGSIHTDMEIAAREVTTLRRLYRPNEEVSSMNHSTAPEPHPSTDETPHACNDGWVTIGQLVVDPETGEEREEFAQYLCRKCAERS